MASTADEVRNGIAAMPDSVSPQTAAAGVTKEAVDAALAAVAESEPAAAPTEVDAEAKSAPAPDMAVAVGSEARPTVAVESKKWPGWPGDTVFRMIVPVLKVGSIIGRKGEFVKKMCEETRARIRVLDGPSGSSDRIVLISGREDMEAEISPAMDAVARVFKRVHGITETEGDDMVLAAGTGVCSVRLLVASSQAINLIGKGGTLIKSIQEGTGASVRVLSGDEVPFYATSDERIVEIQGDSLKVLKALEAVVGHLRKFLVDHSVIPLFEKSYSSSTTSIPQDHLVDAWGDKTQSYIQTSQTRISNDYPISAKKDSLFLDHEPSLDSQIQRIGLSLYGQGPASAGLRSSGLGRATTGTLVTQVTQKMQIPMSYAEDIIGIGGVNIAYIRRTSGAILSVQESGVPHEIMVEIKGTSKQVQNAQELIHDFIAGHKEPAATVSNYDSYDTGLPSSYSSYPSSSLTQSYGGYGFGVSGYGNYRY